VAINTSDPFAAPLINPNLLGTDFDFEVMKFAIRSAQRFAAGPAWTDYIIAPFDGVDNTTMAGTDEELGEYVRANTATIFHPVGTTAMSPVGADWGVVDPDLRVKGVSGLRVVDAGVLVRIYIFVHNDVSHTLVCLCEAYRACSAHTGTSVYCWRKSSGPGEDGMGYIFSPGFFTQLHFVGSPFPETLSSGSPLALCEYCTNCPSFTLTFLKNKKGLVSAIFTKVC
jgi:hypothetical protein